jgi:uncharacterized protein
MTPLSPADRGVLLGVARSAVLARLALAPAPPLPGGGALAEERGAFVTLHVAGELRGCIGTFRPQGSLAATVGRMAAAAASEDPRFPPVRPDEVARLQIAVSALGTSFAVADPRAIEVGRHGLLVKRGLKRGTLLPRVAIAHRWTAHQFLKHTCLKAGLPPRAWEDSDVEIEAFEAEEFGEEPAA